MLDLATDFGVAGILGGASAAFTTPDISIILRALKTAGRLEVLSSPHITVTDNEPAEIKVGQNVPIIRNTRVTDNGTQISTIEYRDVGIILRVTPHINPDGYVKLDINPEISGIGAATLQVSETVSAATYFERSAKTQVSIRDGETIVIGGLITDDRTTTEDKVPILGDIPIIKYLFSRTRERREKTELLIMITPIIVPSPDDLADAGARASLTMKGAPERFRRYDVPTGSRYDLYKRRMRELEAKHDQRKAGDRFRYIEPNRGGALKPKARDLQTPPGNGKEIKSGADGPVIKETKVHKPAAVIVNGKG